MLARKHDETPQRSPHKTFVARRHSSWSRQEPANHQLPVRLKTANRTKMRTCPPATANTPYMLFFSHLLPLLEVVGSFLIATLSCTCSSCSSISLVRVIFLINATCHCLCTLGHEAHVARSEERSSDWQQQRRPIRNDGVLKSRHLVNAGSQLQSIIFSSFRNLLGISFRSRSKAHNFCQVGSNH